MGETTTLDVGALSHPGSRERQNEDSLATPPELSAELAKSKGYLFVVADGMGGHHAGERASKIAVATIMDQYYADPSPDVEQSLAAAIARANAEIHRQGQEPAFDGMGTTIVAAVIHDGWLIVAHVGDSRAYVLGQRGLGLLTADHSYTADMIREGLLTEAEAQRHPYRHVLTRALGTKPAVPVDVQRVALAPGETVLLCTDGLWKVVSDGQMRHVLRRNPPREAAQRLVDLANARGGPDNITLIAIRTQQQGGALGVGPGRRLFMAGSALVFLAVLAAAIGRGWRVSRLPTVAVPQVQPVRYLVLAGDTHGSIARYFEVAPGFVPDPLEPGQQLELQPGGYGLLVAGRVRSVRTTENGVALELASRDARGTIQRRAIECETGNRAFFDPDQEPRRGDLVATLITGDGERWISAWAYVRERDGWRQWYGRPGPVPTWVYTAFDPNLLRPPNDEDEGQPVLARGIWFQGAAEDLFVLRGDAYESLKPPADRLSTVALLAPAASPTIVTMVPTDTPEAATTVPIPTNGVPTALPAVTEEPTPTVSSGPTLEPTPIVTATPWTTPAPTVTPDPTLEPIHGRVTALPCANLRAKPVIDLENFIECLPPNERVEISCRELETRDPEDWWYQVTVERTGQTGYVFHELIDIKYEQVPICSGSAALAGVASMIGEPRRTNDAAIDPGPAPEGIDF